MDDLLEGGGDFYNLFNLWYFLYFSYFSSEVRQKKRLFLSKKMIRQGYNHFNSQRNRKYITKKDIELLAYIKKHSKIDWKILLINFKYEVYVWRFYPTLKNNLKITTFSKQIELNKTNNGLPKNILFIVYLVNSVTCFNARVRYYFYILNWYQKIFLFYDRYYRYLGNEKKFGKRKIVPKRYSYKVHFIPYFYRRQLTGVRIDRNRKFK